MSAKLGKAARAFARHRLRRIYYVGVPRSVVEQRVRRGDAGLGGGGVNPAAPADVLEDFYAYQVHEAHARADAAA